MGPLGRWAGKAMLGVLKPTEANEGEDEAVARMNMEHLRQQLEDAQRAQDSQQNESVSGQQNYTPIPDNTYNLDTDATVSPVTDHHYGSYGSGDYSPIPDNNYGSSYENDYSPAPYSDDNSTSDDSSFDDSGF